MRTAYGKNPKHSKFFFVQQVGPTERRKPIRQAASVPTPMPFSGLWSVSQILVPDFEKSAANRFFYDAEADAPDISLDRSNRELVPASQEPLLSRSSFGCSRTLSVGLNSSILEN